MSEQTTELSEQIKAIIENEPVSLFMKGTPQLVMCGNSDRALRALREPLGDGSIHELRIKTRGRT